MDALTCGLFASTWDMDHLYYVPRHGLKKLRHEISSRLDITGKRLILEHTIRLIWNTNTGLELDSIWNTDSSRSLFGTKGMLRKWLQSSLNFTLEWLIKGLQKIVLNKAVTDHKDT